MVRVLHVINGASLGGISSMILNYYKNIDREKVHFDFVTSFENGENGIKLEELGAKFFFIEKKSNGLLRHILALNSLMKNEHFDAIHVHSNHTSYVALAVAWKNGIPVRIAHGHNAMPDNMTIRSIISRSVGTRLIKLFATTRLACSKQSAIYTFGERSLNDKNVAILPNAIDIKKYKYNEEIRNKLRNELGIREEDIVLGCVGRMSPEKNHEFLINILPKLIEKNNKLKLVLVGDGDERKRLEVLAKQNNVIDYIIFTGECSNVHEYLSVFDVFALPSKSEGLGIVAIEAAAAGLPVILSDNITTELKFIPNSIYINLDQETMWIEKILEFGEKKIRTNPSTIDIVLSENGYDISEEVKKLEHYYKV